MVLRMKGGIVLGKQRPNPSPSPEREGGSYPLEWGRLFWNLFGGGVLVIIKGKMVCVISCDDLLLFTT